ncbi:hypothetical protein R5R35_007122 [Gryllus longicercus]|uniref:ubiquitinyl hydrolase 1 n=1 Tax=Gryllus longicercus TaxID=2509291 RepID=A0AAN9Z859_9ORTH
MPGEHLKPLYKGKCLEDLKQFFEITIETDPKRLYRSAPKLFRAAEEQRLKGDEELSYIYYMKFLSIVQRFKQYKNSNRKEILDSGEVKKHHVTEALDFAEKLSSSLEDRYAELKKRETEAYLAKKLKESVVAEKVTNVQVIPQPIQKSNGFADVSEEFMSCAKLYNLLDEKRKLLIMDVRSVSSYNDSHLKAECVINVPDNVVEAGMTSSRLEKVLPAASKILWSMRGVVDLVVLIDWSTSVNTQKSDLAIFIVRDILVKWDSNIIYKNCPLILEGGYEEWLLRYPVCTTNPSPKIIPNVPSYSSSDFLDDIEYPNFLEGSDQPTIDRSSKPSFNHSYPMKPSISASTFSKPIAPKSPKLLPSTPFTNIPSKPVAPNKGLTPGPMDSRPSVDRKSKAAALLTYEERSRNVQALLRQEEEVVATTLEMEEDKLRKEEEREKIRLRREMEAEEEMRAFLQEREEQLLRDIQNLEKLQQEKDKENQALREELAEYKKKEQEESLPREYSVYKEQEEAIAARIRNSEEKRKKLVQDRESKKVREEYYSQKKKLSMDEALNPSPIKLTYEEREAQALAKLQQDRLHREKQKQGKVDDMAKERGHQDTEDFHSNRSPVPSKSPLEVNRDLKKSMETRNEQPTNFKNKMNGTYTAPLKDTPSGMMKRSRSSPNIAQLNDEDMNGRGKPMKTNFASDIRASRQRNFSPVYGDLGRGLTGLKNLGNTCYMNSIIQCLSNTTPLAKYFVSGQYRNDINRHNETRGEIAEEVAAVVRALWSSSYKCIATRDLRSVVGRHRDQFQTNQQQDSNEFLTILMDWLHEDLKKPSVKSIGDVGRDQDDWEKQWDEFYKENTSLIVLLFYGQQKSTVRCLKCFKESVKYETFSNLTLPLPSNINSCTLEECVQLYVRGEHITGWKCPACKEQRDAMKKFDIIKLPPILVIHFKRFYIDGWCRKRQTFVQFPLVNLDMKKHTLLPDQKYIKYNLYGVSNHYGTMEGGHYTAYCKSVEHKKWYKFDDNEVSEISPGEVQSGAAYILFYASINFNVPDVS